MKSFLYKVIVALCCLQFIFNLSYASFNWQCFAFNSKHESYQASGITINKAMLNAKKYCNTHNKHHTPCNVAQSFCHKKYVTITKNVRCIVSDQKGKIFTQDNCKDAMSTCQQWQYKYGVTRAGGCIVNHKIL